MLSVVQSGASVFEQSQGSGHALNYIWLNYLLNSLTKSVESDHGKQNMGNQPQNELAEELA